MSADRDAAPQELFVEVRVQPRASREGIDGWVAGRLRIRVNAPPVENAANRRVEALLAREFAAPRSGVEVVAGATRREKRLRIRGAKRTPDWLERG